jgi:CIC family chloride channel protein
MISNLISFFISRQLQPDPIYEALALQEGVHLPTGESRAELAGDRVDDVMVHIDDETLALPAGTDIATAKAFLDTRQCNSWPVGDRQFIIGVIIRRDLDAAPGEAQTLRDLIPPDAHFPFVHADHPVSVALERMRESGVDVVPVVNRAIINEIEGVIGLREILAAYGVPDSAFFSRSMPA